METALESGGIAPTIAPTNMKQKITYKTRHIRMDEVVWETLKKNRKKSQLSWNQFMQELNYLYKNGMRRVSQKSEDNSNSKTQSRKRGVIALLQNVLDNEGDDKR